MWVVLDGIVEIVKQTPKGPLCLSMVADGSFVGDIATFLAKEHVRGASVKARGTVQLGVIDSQRLSNEFSALSRDFRDLLLSFDRRLKHVSGNVLRIRLNHPILADLQGELTPFEFGESSEENIFMITDGKASVVRAMGKDNIKVVLAELSSGDFIGKIPFLDTGLEPYNAELLVSSDFKTEPLDPKKFLPEYDRLSTTFKNIIKHISASIPVTIKTAEESFSGSFSGSESKQK
jgi:CRP-like cAMP-binding protein